MGLIKPRVITPSEPASEDEQARREEHIVQLRHEASERDRERQVLVRPLLELQDPPLRDIDAAVACSCSCHPRPAQASLHDSGYKCNCQLTPEERAENMKLFFDLLAEIGGDEIEEQRHSLALARGEELGVQLERIGGAAPFVIEGRIRNRSFYLRSRHDSYTLEISPADNPEVNINDREYNGPVALIAQGDDSEILDYSDGELSDANALSRVVGMLDEYFLKEYCPHENSENARYCPECGTRL